MRSVCEGVCIIMSVCKRVSVRDIVFERVYVCV